MTGIGAGLEFLDVWCVCPELSGISWTGRVLFKFKLEKNSTSFYCSSHCCLCGREVTTMPRDVSSVVVGILLSVAAIVRCQHAAVRVSFLPSIRTYSVVADGADFR